MMLAIEVAFLTGRFVATAYNTRTESEWPPHPARLFSALAATHFADEVTSNDRRSGEREVLEWLERQGAPSIVASDAVSREAVTVFVPVNDVALTDVDGEASDLDEARSRLSEIDAAVDPKGFKKASTTVKKAEAALEKAIARATSVPARAMDPRHGQRVLPEYRGRQPRTFPSMTPVDPRVTYLWPSAAPTSEQRAIMDGLLGRLVRLGHSSSLVSARLVDNPDTPIWRPVAGGEAMFRIVESGQLDALERAFERHREIEPRVMPAAQQAYTQEAVQTIETRHKSLFSDHWIVLRRVAGPSFPMTATAGVARAVRKALMSFAEEPIPEALSGHSSGGGPTQQPHLAIVPLPFVGHAKASGGILGIALILPRTTSNAARRAVYTAVDRWEQRYRQDDEDVPAVQLNLGAAGELRLERVEWRFVQSSLKPHVWCSPARVWSSVTPVALDRNPGDLRSRDPGSLAKAIEEAVESIRRACQRIELPRPAHVEILPAAPWAGSEKARHYPSFPGDAGRTQRVLTHVRIEFDEYVAGPVLLGAGRYVGLGLLRPEASR
jgi:CRISPR-associated protein Csb2